MNQLILLCKGGRVMGFWILAPGAPPGSIAHTLDKRCQG